MGGPLCVLMWGVEPQVQRDGEGVPGLNPSRGEAEVEAAPGPREVGDEARACLPVKQRRRCLVVVGLRRSSSAATGRSGRQPTGR